MKKIICLMFVVIFALSFIACGKNFQTEKVATSEEKTQYFENRKLEETYAYEFKVVYKESNKTKTVQSKSNYSIKGKVEVGADDTYSIEYNGKRKSKIVNATINDKEKGTYKVKEKGVILCSKKGEYGNKIEKFFDIKENRKEPYRKSKYNAKTVSVDRLSSYVPGYSGAAYNGVSLTSIISNVQYGSGYFFIDGDNCTYISSGSSQTKTIMVFDGNKIKEIIITVESANYTKTTKIKFVDSVSISAPSDKTEYDGYKAE